MAVGTLCFLTILASMLRVFTKDAQVVEIGRVGFHFVGVSFLPMVTSLIFPARTDLVLDDVPGYRAPYQYRGSAILPAFFETRLWKAGRRVRCYADTYIAYK